MNTGRRANRSGQHLESFVAGLLDDLGYAEASSRLFFNLCEQQQPIYAYECYAGETIYGGRRRVDFILHHPVKHPKCLVIQCKWQTSGGSVDQKYPYEVLSINANSYPSIIILDGGGYSAGAERWLKAQAGKEQLLYVFNQGKFARYASPSQGNL